MEERTFLSQLLEMLPDGSLYEKDLSLDEGDLIGVGECGDADEWGRPICKLLTRQGRMHTYVREGDIFLFLRSESLH